MKIKNVMLFSAGAIVGAGAVAVIANNRMERMKDEHEVEIRSVIEAFQRKACMNGVKCENNIVVISDPVEDESDDEEEDDCKDPIVTGTAAAIDKKHLVEVNLNKPDVIDYSKKYSVKVDKNEKSDNKEDKQEVAFEEYSSSFLPTFITEDDFLDDAAFKKKSIIYFAGDHVFTDANYSPEEELTETSFGKTIMEAINRNNVTYIRDDSAKIDYECYTECGSYGDIIID